MAESVTGEIVKGLWRFEALHPEWTEDEGDGEDGWEQTVAWWAVEVPAGFVLIDPLVDDWDALDHLVEDRGGCAGVVRTCHWHQRSVTDVARRYSAEVWAKRTPGGPPDMDHPVCDQNELFGGVRAFDVERDDEIALWLPHQSAVVFGDAMIRTANGELRVCPDSWTQPEGGPTRLRDLLSRLMALPVEHVLVSHGRCVLSDGAASLRAALA